MVSMAVLSGKAAEGKIFSPGNVGALLLGNDADLAAGF